MSLNDSEAPGVFIKEVSAGARPIQAVGTSTAGFLGSAPKADAHRLQPIAVYNWTQFKLEFVGKSEAAYTHLAYAVRGFFENGGACCYVVNLCDTANDTAGKPLDDGLAALGRIDEVSIVAAPGYTDPTHYEALISHCGNLKDRVAILDTPEDVASLEALKTGDLRPGSSSYATLYYPWIEVRALDGGTKRIMVPPSGHIAGIWARSDSARGVHKAPANEPVRGAAGLKVRLTNEEQGPLNKTGVNCIRYFPGEGIVVWGARTLDASGLWRYLNVRRLFNMIEESIEESTRWIVFEPNDETLWKAIKRDVTAFLTRIWRTGALMGATPDQAFFVKCDAETNPQDEIDAGRVTIVIGIAPVKPAEFVVFQISQESTGAQVAEGGG